MQLNTMTTNAFNPAQSTNYASKYTMPSPQMPSSNYSLGTQTGLKTPVSTALNASGATNLSFSERNKLAGQNKLNAINNATSAENLPKPKWQVGSGKGNYTAQKQAYNAKAQEFGLKTPLTPEQQAQKADKSKNAAQYALAGIDTAVNLANAGMSYANMAKQWEFMRDSMKLARDQYNDEKDRYNKREQERLNARDDARGAQQAVFGQKQWHDPDAQSNSSEGQSSEGQSSEGEQKEEETSFTRA